MLFLDNFLKNILEFDTILNEKTFTHKTLIRRIKGFLILLYDIFIHLLYIFFIITMYIIIFIIYLLNYTLMYFIIILLYFII